MKYSKSLPPNTFNLLIAGSHLGAGKEGNPAQLSLWQQSAMHSAFGFLDIHSLQPQAITDEQVQRYQLHYEQHEFPNLSLESFATHLHWYENLRERCLTLLESGKPLFVLGGDHGISSATLAATSTFIKNHQLEPRLLWLDAHFDLHTPQSSHSGNWHGMPFANLLGFSSHPAATQSYSSQQVMHYGARSFESEELIHLQSLGIASATSNATKGSNNNYASCMIEALEPFFAAVTQTPKRLPNGAAPYAITLDLDLLDPDFFKATSLHEPSTPQSMAPTPRDLLQVLEYFFVEHKTPVPVSFEIMEYNPKMDEPPYAFDFFDTLLRTIYFHYPKP